MKQTNKRYGLALGGGGAKIWYLYEALSKLINTGYTFQVVGGVSSGALVAYMYASGQMLKLSSLLKRISNDQVYKGKPNLWAAIKAKVLGRDYLLDNSPLRDLIVMYVDRPVHIHCHVGVVDLESGQYESVNLYGMGLDYIREHLLASATIPIIWKPVNISTQISSAWADGGLRNNSPVSDVLRQGIDELWVINTSSVGAQLWDYHHKRNLFNMAGRTLEIMLDEGLTNDIHTANLLNSIMAYEKRDQIDSGGRMYRKVPIHLIQPTTQLHSMLDFNTRQHRGLGYRDAEHAIAGVKYAENKTV